MKEKQFRAWDKRNKKMLHHLSGIIWNKPVVPADYCDGLFDYDRPSNYEFITDEMMMVDECELMEYTGLKDKNRKEIYEGDIVEMYEVWGHDLEEEEDKYWIGQIKFHTGCFWFEAKGRSENCWFQHNEEDFEIIGNIYENPELLEKQAA